MNFNPNDEQRLLIDAASRYVRENCPLEKRRQFSKTEDGFSRQHWANFAEMGWLALMVPERADGLGWSVTDLAVLMEELGRGLVSEPLVDTAVLCTSILDSAANQTADELLRGIASGENLWALAHIEGNGRSEFDTEVTLSAVKQGDAWQLNGTKTLVYYGHNADQYLITARTGDGQKAIYVVPADCVGVSKNSYELINGCRAADVTLANVSVPASAQLLVGEAVDAALELAIDKSIVAQAAALLGGMEAVMAATAEHLKTRVQYGKPLAQFQALQHRMSEMLVEAEQVRSILYRTLSVFEDDSLRHSAVSALKVLTAESGLWVTSQGIQLHGGIGVTEEYAVGHHYKMAITFDKRFGDNDWHLDNYQLLDS